jgi:hypothetical protein
MLGRGGDIGMKDLVEQENAHERNRPTSKRLNVQTLECVHRRINWMLRLSLSGLACPPMTRRAANASGNRKTTHRPGMRNAVKRRL